jgi:hypothetical protein
MASAGGRQVHDPCFPNAHIKNCGNTSLQYANRVFQLVFQQAKHGLPEFFDMF